MRPTLASPRVVVVLAFTAALLAGTGIGVALGTHHQAHAQLAVGWARSTRFEVSVITPDWTYAVPLDTPWYDRTGDEHEGSRPACLPPSGTVKHVAVEWVGYSLHGTTQRQVVAVNCAAA